MEQFCESNDMSRLEKDNLLDYHFLQQKIDNPLEQYQIQNGREENKKDSEFKQKEGKDYLLSQFNDTYVSNRGNYLMNQQIVECLLNESVLKVNIQMMLENMDDLEYKKNEIEFPFMIDFIIQY